MIDEDDVATGEFDAVELELDADGNPVVPLVTEDWMWEIQGAVDYMRKRSKFRVDQEDFFRPVPDIVKGMVESAAGMTAAPTIASLFDVTDGYELRWSRKEGDEFVPVGSIHLYGFAEVFGNWLHKLWGEHPLGIEELRKHNPSEDRVRRWVRALRKAGLPE